MGREDENQKDWFLRLSPFYLFSLLF